VPTNDSSPTSVDNALRVLLLFRSRQILRVADVAEDLGVARSTAHRLLVALVKRGFAGQDPVTRAYTPGSVLTDIGVSVLGMLGVRNAAQRPMRALADALHETVSLVVLEGANARLLDAIESTHAVRVGARNGQLHPAHCVSGGKVLLSRLPREQIDDLYPDEELVTMTPASIKTKSDLLVELERIRRNGYSTNTSESEQDVSAVAVIIESGGSRAAISVAAPTTRVPARSVDRLARATLKVMGQLDNS
jgi:IclR family acetate operon transcriptional repressor